MSRLKGNLLLGKRRPSRSPFGFFFWLAIAGFLALAGFGIQEVWSELSTRKWTETPCEIVESKVDANAGSNGAGYVPYVQYRYKFAGRTYTSDKIHIKPELTHSDYVDAAERLARYPVGAKIFCRVNPVDPRQAVLESKPDYTIFFISPFLVLIWAVYERVPLTDWLRNRKLRRQGRPAPMTANIHLRRSGRKQLLVGFTGVVFCLVFVVADILWPWIQARRARHWQPVPCVLLRSGVATELHHQGGESFKSHVLYSYEYNGRKLESSRLNFDFDFHFSYAAVRKLVAKYHPGQTATAFVDPKDPQQAVLEPDFHPDLFFGLFVAAWGGACVFIIVQVSLARRTAQIVLPWERRKWKTNDGADRIVLRVKQPPILMFLLCSGGTLACIILSVWLLVNASASLFHGHIDVIPWLYGIGLFIGAGYCVQKAIYFSYAFVAQPPKLLLQPRVPRIGQPFTVEWERRDRTSAGFRLSLEGWEEGSVVTTTATMHGASRSEKIERNRFFRLPLTGSEGFETAPFGQARAATPLTAMHSLEASSLKILWQVAAELPGRRGAILKYNYKFVLRPNEAKP